MPNCGEANCRVSLKGAVSVARVSASDTRGEIPGCRVAHPGYAPERKWIRENAEHIRVV